MNSEIVSISTANTVIPKKRGRKSANSASENKVMMKQHHFNYSEDFATMLANFATIHLEDNNRKFKEAWKEWTEQYSIIVQSEIKKMKDEGKADKFKEILKNNKINFE